MGSSPSPPPVQPVVTPPPPPTPLDPSVVSARNQSLQVAQLNAGRAATVLTSPQGIADDTKNTSKKTVLGA